LPLSPLRSSDNLVDQSLFGLPPPPERGDSNDLLRMVIEELEPFIRRIIGRQHFALQEFCVNGVHQIVQSHAALLSPAGRNHAIDRLFLRPLNDRSQDRTADQIASIEDLILSASEPNRQKSILIDARKDRREHMLDEIGTGLLPISAVLVNPLSVQRQVICQIHVDNRCRRVTVRTAHSDLAINTPWPSTRRARPIPSADASHIYSISGRLTWTKAPRVTGSLSPFVPVPGAPWPDSPASLERLAAAACPIKVFPQPGGP